MKKPKGPTCLNCQNPLERITCLCAADPQTKYFCGTCQQHY